MKVRRHKQRGYWEVYFRYPDPDDPTKRKTFRKKSPVQTRRGAEAWGREMLALHSDPRRLREQRAEAPTLEGFAAEVDRVVWSHEVKARTRQNYLSITSSRVLPTLGQLRLDEIGPREVARWRADLLAAGLSAGYVNQCVTILRLLLRQAVTWEVIDRAPEVARVPDRAESWDWLREDEQARLVRVMDGHPLDRMITVALHTGARVGELVALEWGDVDLERQEVTIRRTGWHGETTSPKSGRARTVPLNASAVQALREQRAQTYLAGDLVWRGGPGGGAMYTLASPSHHLRGRLKQAGLRRIRFHDLRHTFASRLVQSGVSLQVVQQLLGHSSITITQRYAHLAPDQLADAVAALERATDCAEVVPLPADSREGA